jgi:hypothetical protein
MTVGAATVGLGLGSSRDGRAGVGAGFRGLGMDDGAAERDTTAGRVVSTTADASVATAATGDGGRASGADGSRAVAVLASTDASSASARPGEAIASLRPQSQ